MVTFFVVVVVMCFRVLFFKKRINLGLMEAIAYGNTNAKIQHIFSLLDRCTAQRSTVYTNSHMFRKKGLLDVLINLN